MNRKGHNRLVSVAVTVFGLLFVAAVSDASTTARTVTCIYESGRTWSKSICTDNTAHLTCSMLIHWDTGWVDSECHQTQNA